ncbi:MAG: SUMF1/EgtB/PvdO family nonheme iron enzyme [Planctomycetota bacterium]
MGRQERLNLPEITQDYLLANSVCMSEVVFPLGTKYEYISDTLKELDSKRHLNIANILDATPPYYIHLPQFWVGKKLVTNGEYSAFLHYMDDQGKKFYDEPDVWRYIWSTLNYKIENVKMPFRTYDGSTAETEENYSDCESFVEAYLNSLRFEMERVILSREGMSNEEQTGASRDVLVVKKSGSKTQCIGVSKGDTLPRFFALAKYKLRNAILCQGEDLDVLLSPTEREMLGYYYSDPQRIEKDASELINQLRNGYLQTIDKRFVQAFRRGQHRVETILFIERLKHEIAKCKDFDETIPLSRVIYPRFWDTPEGTLTKDLLKRSVDWSDKPVNGLTLYESVAFIVWLSSITGLEVMLPNEAEYERTASWSAESNINDNSEIIIDPRKKSVLPWENTNDRDFNSFLGQDGKEIDKYYIFHKGNYENLLEDTARTADKDKIYQLVGFGWHWMADRYDEDERKYSRFRSDEYQKYTKVPTVLNDGTKVSVFEYEPDRNVKLPYFVLRGSPDIIGGPGLVTRRFCTYPMRGYPQVCFRWAIHGVITDNRY